MEANQASSTTTSSLDKELTDCWCEEPTLGGDGGAVYHALSAAALLKCKQSGNDEAAEKNDPDGVFLSALGLLIALFRAERGFLFAVERGSGDKQTLGAPLTSRDLDGEPVSQPERRVPRAALVEAICSRKPSLCAVTAEAAATSEEDSRAPSQGVALPVESTDRVEAVIYLENRFQPLDLTRESLRLARTYAAVLGSLVELARVRRENETLWADVARMRDQQPSEAPRPELTSDRALPRTPKRSSLKGDYSLIVGSCPRMLEIFQVLDRISGSNAPVLINGESGTGKELVANAVHANSPRAGKVFVSENCGALTETLLESELFGYAKGAFTGANKDHKGLFELAIGGTLFLDEVGDMSPSMQKKLLRVLQESVIRRVGGKDYIPVDVRIISATNKDLLAEVKAGNFREDLYYRLNVINLKMPPLRDRREDVPALVTCFLAQLEQETGIKRAIDAPTMARLARHSWPGNVRELRNEIKRLHALADGDIRLTDLSEGILAGESPDLPLHDIEKQLSHLTLREATERIEKELIRHALVQCRGNKSLMAKMLQVPKTSLYSKISKYGLEKL